jgi:hypothetical protein
LCARLACARPVPAACAARPCPPIAPARPAAGVARRGLRGRCGSPGVAVRHGILAPRHGGQLRGRPAVTRCPGASSQRDQPARPAARPTLDVRPAGPSVWSAAASLRSPYQGTRLIKRGSSQGLVYQGTRPHPSPASGKDSSPGWIHASPEGLLRQRAHPRLARSPAWANFVVQRPRPNRLTHRPYRMRI